jgi:hypothetical protein
MFPWENKIEKAFFRGSPTGCSYTHISPNKNFPTPEKVAEIINRNPQSYQRPYLARMGVYNSDLIDAKLTFGDWENKPHHL